jgi:AsmA protein
VKRLLKLIVWALGLGFALLLVLAIVLPRIVDPNDFKDRIAQLVHDRTGRELTIEGDLSVSLFPWLRLRTGALSLANARGFGDAPLASVRSADVGLKLLPLLQRRFEIDTIRFSGLTLNLETDTSGRSNWDDLLPAGDDSGPLPLAAVAANGLEVRDSRLVYSNRASKSHYVLQSLNLDIGRIVSGVPVPVSVRFELFEPDRDQPLPVELGTTLTLDMAAQRIALRDTLLHSTVAGGETRLLAPELTYQLDSQLLDLRELDLRYGGLPVPLSGKVPTARLDVGRQQLSVPRVEAVAGGAELSGSINGNRVLDAPSLYGRFQTPVLDLRKVLPAFGAALETSDPAALSKFSLHAVYQAGADKLSVQEIRMLLDDSSITGSVSIPSFAHKRFGFELALDQLNLDRYLSAAGRRRAGEGTEAEGVPGAMLFALPAALLQGLDGKGRLRARSLQFGGLVTEDIVIGVEATGGVTRLAPIQGQLYDGRLDGGITLDASQEVPQLKVEESLTAVQLEPLLTAAGVTKKLGGTGTLNIDLAGNGRDGREVLRSLSGETRFQLRDGVIRGFDPASIIRKAYSLYKQAKGKEQEVEASESEEFRFTQMGGKLMFNNGVASNDDLDIRSPLFRISGRGTVDLVAQTMNYLLDISVVGTLKGQGGESLEDLKGVTIPVRIKGPLASPSRSVDMGVLAKRELKKAIIKELQGDKPPAQQPPGEPATAPAPKKDDKQQLEDLLLRELKKNL